MVFHRIKKALTASAGAGLPVRRYLFTPSAIIPIGKWLDKIRAAAEAVKRIIDIFRPKKEN